MLFFFCLSLSFQTQAPLQPLHFPEQKCIQSLQLHTSYTSHQTQLHLLCGMLINQATFFFFFLAIFFQIGQGFMY